LQPAVWQIQALAEMTNLAARGGVAAASQDVGQAQWTSTVVSAPSTWQTLCVFELQQYAPARNMLVISKLVKRDRG
jgi:hypothetical protein